MDAAFFAGYNALQAGRHPRSLFLQAQRLAGDGAGRLAIDIGAGSGNETAALLWNGWRVLAIDRDVNTEARVNAQIDTRQVPDSALRVWQCDFADIEALPPADLIYAGYSLPFAGSALPQLWQVIREALPIGGVLAVNLFGDRDSLVETDPDTMGVTREQAMHMLDGLDVVDFAEQEEDGPSYRGTKHWHVFHVLARGTRVAQGNPMRRPAAVAAAPTMTTTR